MAADVIDITPKRCASCADLEARLRHTKTETDKLVADLQGQFRDMQTEHARQLDAQRRIHEAERQNWKVQAAKRQQTGTAPARPISWWLFFGTTGALCAVVALLLYSPPLARDARRMVTRGAATARHLVNRSRAATTAAVTAGWKTFHEDEGDATW